MGNPVFKQFDDIEHEIYRDSVDEQCEMFGQDVFYIPIESGNMDYLYGEDPLSSFPNKYAMTLYVVSNPSWESDGDLFSKFGLVMTETMVFSIEQQRFTTYTGLDRPKIGDLIYLPWTREKKLMEITHVDAENQFYHMGKPVTWRLNTKVFVYSHEDVNYSENPYSGSPELDEIKTSSDNWEDNVNISQEFDELKDWTENNPFGES